MSRLPARPVLLPERDIGVEEDLNIASNAAISTATRHDLLWGNQTGCADPNPAKPEPNRLK
jgi:hypothetical protein